MCGVWSYKYPCLDILTSFGIVHGVADLGKGEEEWDIDSPGGVRVFPVRSSLNIEGINNEESLKFSPPGRRIKSKPLDN